MWTDGARSLWATPGEQRGCDATYEHADNVQDLRMTCNAMHTRQVREDVTRYRYGDEQHLDEALDRVFRFNKVSKTIQADRKWLGVE